MYGFICCEKKMKIVAMSELKGSHSIVSDNIQIWYNPLPKFENDHIFVETSQYIILLDGVIFNKQELLMDTKPGLEWKECFIKLYEARVVPDCLRGSFRGLIYEKDSQRLLVFTNHTGEKTVYYTKDAEFGFIVSSHVNIIKDIFRSNGRKGFSANIQAHYELLLTGSVLHGNTPYKNIYRLTAGKVLKYSKEFMEIEWYHKFKNTPEHEYTLDECVDKANALLRQAVDRIFRKNVEYGYKAECDLSGGLDSRFATWIAHDLGYKNILNVCYCVKGNLDNIISEKIAKDIGNDYFFLPMNAFVMGDIDEKSTGVGGQVLYMLSTGALYALKEIGNQEIGMMCTGLMGEIQNAYWTEGLLHTRADYTKNRKSYYYELKLPGYYCDDYENYEQMNLYEYSFQLFLLSTLIRNEYVEVASPFLDPDYMDFVFRVPLKLRKNYYFSQYMMCNKYKAAAAYNWQGKRMPVDKHFYKMIYIPKIIDDIRNTVIKIINKALRITHINHQFYRKDDMNPIETWYRNSREIRLYLDDYYNEGIRYVKDDRLKNDLDNMYHRSQLATDKIQVVNVIAVWKNYIT